ncbi:MAG: M15 family metallopeptidase [Treponema sp.]|nr:M15 family metallopeptidase [Treponema sp.]
MKKSLKIACALFAVGVVVLVCLFAKNKSDKDMLKELEQMEMGVEVALNDVPKNTNNKKSSADEKKVDLIVSRMSPRFQKELKETICGNKKQFLEELYVVLEDEKAGEVEGCLPLYFLIDKKHKAEPETYVPSNLVPLVKNNYYNISRNDLSLREDVEAKLVEMAKAARKDGITLLVSSTYRSYEYQKALFQRWVKIDGLEEAERESAREGTSQHQLGVAIDFGSIDSSFINTSQGKWLNNHSEEYGWSLSFPREYEDITGFKWECWHFRYIGVNACKFQNKWFNDVQQYMIEFIDEWKKS